MLNKLRIITCLLAWLLVANCGWSQRLDVDLKQGTKKARGEFRSTTPDTLVLENEQIPADNIRAIAIDGEPSEMKTARRRFDDSRFDDGLSELNKITDRVSSKVIEQELDFLRAYGTSHSALYGGTAVPNDALSLCNEFVNRYSQSYRLYPIVELQGLLQTMLGADREAVAKFDQLVASQSEEFKLRGNYFSAVSLMNIDQSAAAAQRFQTVLGTSLKSESATRMKLLAEPMYAKSLALSGQVDEARKRAEAIIQRESSENQELFAATYNVLGICELKSGNLNLAAIQFLHTVLLFPIGEFHAEALYYLAREVWPQLERSDQAMESRETLRRLYPRSAWYNKLNR
ncbi:MAG: hypothetical protein KF851_07690 [Pirellulaceae bacterium]|jgi:tetratricopeptide (TPR) repeat protein|nr:hypothetical protein [Pirellulaceae bacterium]